MTTFLINSEFFSHPAALNASLEGIGLWTKAGSWCARHSVEGFIPRHTVPRLGDEAAAQSLVRAGLWRRTKGGFQMLAMVPAAPGCPPVELWRIRRTGRRAEIPERIRRAVFERDGHACVTCGATAGLVLDHIYPWSKGGTDDAKNLQVLCNPCNSRKGAKV